MSGVEGRRRGEGEGGRKFGVGPLSLTGSNVCSSHTDVMDNVACTTLPHAVAHRSSAAANAAGTTSPRTSRAKIFPQPFVDVTPCTCDKCGAHVLALGT